VNRSTYHYGRWDLSAQFGWYWVPQTQWAPAWVSWHSGGGYVGWAPLYPSSRFARSGSLEVDVRAISPRAYVFVEERHFLEPVRRSTVVVNNTTIINKTVNITNVKVVNNTVINDGPRTQIIEQASGRKLQAVPVRELRRKQEAEVVARQRTATPAPEKQEKNVPPPARSEAAPRETKAQQESQQRAKEAAAKAQEESQKTTKGLEKKAQRVSEKPAMDKLDPTETGATRLMKKDLKKKKGKGKPSPPENPPGP
jgi:hypothetical protein